MGEAKYVQLQAVLEMAKRALGEDMKLADALSSPKAVRDYLKLALSRLPHEVFVAVFLTSQNRVGHFLPVRMVLNSCEKRQS